MSQKAFSTVTVKSEKIYKQGVYINLLYISLKIYAIYTPRSLNPEAVFLSGVFANTFFDFSFFFSIFANAQSLCVKKVVYKQEKFADINFV